jgi:hypothetical protein
MRGEGGDGGEEVAVAGVVVAGGGGVSTHLTVSTNALNWLVLGVKLIYNRLLK